MWYEWMSKTYVSDINEEKTASTVSWRENAAPLIKYRLPVMYTRVNTVNLTLTTYNMGPTQQINSRVISTEESRFKLALLPDGVLSVETVRPSRLELDESALINIWQAHKQRQ